VAEQIRDLLLGLLPARSAVNIPGLNPGSDGAGSAPNLQWPRPWALLLSQMAGDPYRELEVRLLGAFATIHPKASACWSTQRSAIKRPLGDSHQLVNASLEAKSRGISTWWRSKNDTSRVSPVDRLQLTSSASGAKPQRDWSGVSPKGDLRNHHDR